MPYGKGTYGKKRGRPSKKKSVKPEKIKELTEFFTRFKYFGPIVTANSVNEVLDKALEHDVKYCIVQATGHIIQEAAF